MQPSSPIYSDPPSFKHEREREQRCYPRIIPYSIFNCRKTYLSTSAFSALSELSLLLFISYIFSTFFFSCQHIDSRFYLIDKVMGNDETLPVGGKCLAPSPSRSFLSCTPQSVMITHRWADIRRALKPSVYKKRQAGTSFVESSIIVYLIRFFRPPFLSIPLVLIPSWECAPSLHFRTVTDSIFQLRAR